MRLHLGATWGDIRASCPHVAVRHRHPQCQARLIGVTEYRLQAAMPARLRGKLPKAKQWEQAMRDALVSCADRLPDTF